MEPTNPSRKPKDDLVFYVANAVVSLAAVALLGWILMVREPHQADSLGAVSSARPLAFMPAVNASFNCLAASFLVMGLIAIKRRNVVVHRAMMLSAFAASSLFLVGYLVYHYVHGDTPYPRTAPFRTGYLLLLASHVILSIVVFPMILSTFYFALRKRFDSHRKIARLTLPIWLYVSVTGVLVFAILRAANGP